MTGYIKKQKHWKRLELLNGVYHHGRHQFRKKSAPDEPPRRRLCVDYRRVNALQQVVERTDKSTGCLTLYPLLKIDEMFAKLGGATIFSTIDLRSPYYHIGLT